MRLIDADALNAEMYHKSFEVDDGRNVWNSGLWIRYKIFEEAIRDAPTVDAVPVRNGKWKWLSCTYDRAPKEKEYECSKCHHKTIVHGDDMPWEKYCPNCGAKMDGREEE